MPTKTFNLILPFSTYRELKHVSMREGKPISEIVRTGIDLALKNIKGKTGQIDSETRD